MATLKEIRLRIASVKSTRKITSAMSRIASARLRRAQNAMLDARPYGERMAEVTGQLVSELDPAEENHPLLADRSVRRVAVFAVTADRGLCGGFNSNVIKATAAFVAEQEEKGHEVVYVSVGRKGAQALDALEQTIHERHPAPDFRSAVELAHTITNQAIGMFEIHDEDLGVPQVDAVYLIYNHFKNVLTQEVRTRQLLPIPPVEPTLDEDGNPVPPPEREYEPDLKGLLDHLLPVSVEAAVQEAMLNSSASELAAKRVAMDAATDNASELIKDLTLEYNRGRQAAITRELIEIISGAQAV